MSEKNTTIPFENILPGRTVTHTTDAAGNVFGWITLPNPADLKEAAGRLAHAGARLCMITAFNQEKFADGGDMEMVYNFDIDGSVLTLTMHVSAEERTVPSIVEHFFNADWHEREFAELYDMKLSGREEPKRLFLDPEIDAGVFNRLVPLSSMMNGASTKRLWETIFAETTMPDWAKEAK